jgi:hypothetical protein
MSQIEQYLSKEKNRVEIYTSLLDKVKEKVVSLSLTFYDSVVKRQ